jgi:pimeloyl-ACP methyl ester carboxylesterase
VLGHDIGGMLTVAYAFRSRDDTRSLIFGECPQPGALRAGFDLYRTFEQLQRLDELDGSQLPGCEPMGGPQRLALGVAGGRWPRHMSY